MKIIIVFILSVASLCLVFLSIAIPWMAVDAWIYLLSAHENDYMALRSVIFTSLISIGILYLDWKLVRLMTSGYKETFKPQSRTSPR